MYILDFHNPRAIEEIDQSIDAHRAFLLKYSAQNGFLFAGAKVPRTVGIIVVSEIEPAQLDSIVAEAPFVRNHVSPEFRGSLKLEVR